MNPYDNPNFFEKYSQMNRSKEGLAGAGEWPTLKAMLPDFHNKQMLDLGSGYGWHCIYAAKQGAKSVIGVESSKKMLEVAKEKTTSPKIKYIHSKMEAIEFPEKSFDLALSSLAFHYVKDLEPLIQKISILLKDDGDLIFTVEHPTFTANGTQDWHYNTQGEIKHFPVDDYFYEGERQAIFLGKKLTKYHRTLTTYIQILLKNGFKIQDIKEPKPPKNLLNRPGMLDEMRRPMMLIISAKKTP
jgi:ubiquinone/menaquinone biosynthesis C-methylase UbiE